MFVDDNFFLFHVVFGLNRVVFFIFFLNLIVRFFKTTNYMF